MFVKENGLINVLHAEDRATIRVRKTRYNDITTKSANRRTELPSCFLCTVLYLLSTF